MLGNASNHLVLSGMAQLSYFSWQAVAFHVKRYSGQGIDVFIC